jgi:hypothetical protein
MERGLRGRLTGAEPVVFNGIDGSTGDYLRAPTRLGGLCPAGPPADLGEEVCRKAPVPWADVRDLAQTGWAVVFGPGVSRQVRTALRPLLHHRRAEAARVEESFYKELKYRPGETKPDFLERQRVGPGPADPRKMPYYLLLVGGPEAIPYAFQYQLDVQYAAGRIAFETVEEYAAYAASVVDVETHPRVENGAVFFGPEHPADEATRLSARHLVRELAQLVGAAFPDGRVRVRVADQARKADLERLLGGDETPSFLFTAGHGVGFPQSDLLQPVRQGALLCQDWPGPRAAGGGKLPEDYYFSAEDVADSAAVKGLITFLFACYSAGTPRLDSYPFLFGGAPRAIAAHDFSARLPQRLLAHPRGSALAVVGHVDQTFQSSFLWQGAGSQLQTFESAFRSLLAGVPVGAALEAYGQRLGEIAADLSGGSGLSGNGLEPGTPEWTALWLAHHDTRSYVLLGDPAVRLPAGARGEARG